MAGKDGDPGWGRSSAGDSREEAKHLVEEAIAERRKGHDDAAEFVLQQARELDKAAAEESLKQQRDGG